ncbi:MAG: F0F1 ATP synthase subunit epsilon [Chloroflexi bacterium]|nr:F0F1 ATP synthase subunit epsilon [Chloroflexota bacterium]
MAKLTVEIVTAERRVFAESDVDMVVAPGADGVVGILPRHAPLLALLRPGSIRIKKNGVESEMAVGGGFLQVNADRILVLADTAERADEIDAVRAEEARRQAEDALSSAIRNRDQAQAEAARAALRLSMVRIKVASHRRRGATAHAGTPQG